MFLINKLNEQICSELNASAIVSLYGNNQCSLDEIRESCFAGEACMYGFSGSNLYSLIHCACTYVITRNREFCGCVSVDVCNNTIPSFPHIRVSEKSFYLHTLCIDSKFRGKKLATILIKKIKSKNIPIYLTVRTGKNGKRKDLKKLFRTRCEKLVSFYKRQGFEEVANTEDLILFLYRKS